MTDVLTVPTHFGDLSELSQGLMDRVAEDRLILFGPNPLDEGAMVRFAVLLADETPALEGVGRVAAAWDGGDEREPETRYDIVFDQLQLEGRSEVVYERIVLARQSMSGDEPGTGEVNVEELEAASAEAGEVAEATGFDDESDVAADDAVADVSFDDSEPVAAEEFEADVADVSFSESEAPPQHDIAADPFDAPEEGDHLPAGEDFAAESTMIAEAGEMEDLVQRPLSAPPPQLPDAPEGFEIQPQSHGVLGRPIFPASWHPEASPIAEREPPSGYFAYEGGLPIPAEPPRPELDPSYRVSPAPRPDEAAMEQARASAPPPAEQAPPVEEAYAAEEGLEGEDAYAVDEAQEQDSYEEPEAQAYEEPEAQAYEEDGGYEEPQVSEPEVGFDEPPTVEAAIPEEDEGFADPAAAEYAEEPDVAFDDIPVEEP